jgi:DNA-binding IclR family transcriptional regulator
MPGQIREPGRTTTSRVLALLGAFGPDDTELSLAELCRRTGLAPATAHRLVGELVGWGGLERTGGHHYRIGLRLFEIGMRAPGRRGLAEAALPFLEGLYEATRENVYLAVRDGHHAVYLHTLTGTRAVPTPARSGGRLPLHATGMGKALLAFSPPHIIDEVIAAGLARYTPYTITEPARLRRDLAKIGKNGYAVSNQGYSLGTVSIAAPVLGPDGHALAAISVVVHGARAQVGKLGTAVRTAATGIARHTGARRHPDTCTQTSQPRLQRQLS